MDAIEVTGTARRQKPEDQPQTPSHPHTHIRRDRSASRHSWKYMLHGVATKSDPLNEKKKNTVY